VTADTLRRAGATARMINNLLGAPPALPPRISADDVVTVAWTAEDAYSSLCRNDVKR
jgi:hypothetical protein